MMDRILIPTDGSEQARPAVDFGIELAEETGAEIHVVYVVETQANYILTVGLDDADLDEYREYGEDTVSEVVDYLASRGLEGKGVVRTGKVAPEVVEYAAENDIDHIVVGRQGRGAVEQYLGSTAEKIVRMSEVPVTVVRTPMD